MAGAWFVLAGAAGAAGAWFIHTISRTNELLDVYAIKPLQKRFYINFV